MSKKAKALYLLITLIAITVPIGISMSVRGHGYHWSESFANDKRSDNVYQAGVETSIGSQSRGDRREWAVLVKSGGVCYYTGGGQPRTLPSPLEGTFQTGTRGILRSRIEPSKDDLKNLKINGLEWDWAATLYSETRSFTCSSEYFVAVKPKLSFAEVSKWFAIWITWAVLV